MFEILGEGLLVELSEELRAGRGIELANVVDDLTFAHGGCLFGSAQGAAIVL